MVNVKTLKCGSMKCQSDPACAASSEVDRCFNGEMETKYCMVCGDRALGYNFNVVTCESCKAFFRRNACKQKEFKCTFGDTCEITTTTRRFCRKCRLRKCVKVGMLPELIMTNRKETTCLGPDEPKVIRRRRRNKNKGASSGPLKSDCVKKDSAGSSASPPCLSTDEWVDISSTEDYYATCIAAAPAHGQMSSPEEAAASLGEDPRGWFLSNLQLDEENHMERIRQVTEFLKDERDTLEQLEASDVDTQLNCEQAGPVVPVNYGASTSACRQNSDEWSTATFIELPSDFSGMKLFRLEELLTANEVFAAPNSSAGPPISFADTSLVEFMASIGGKLHVQMARRINAFTNLLPYDQITLLKGVLGEMLSLRGVMCYRSDLDSWKPAGFPHRFLSLRIVNNWDMYDSIKRIYESFPSDWRTCEPMMLPLLCILLFNPNRPNLLNRDAIRAEREFYARLLHDYLKSVHSGRRANDIYFHLMDLLQLVQSHVHILAPTLTLEMNPSTMEIVHVGAQDFRNC